MTIVKRLLFLMKKMFKKKRRRTRRKYKLRSQASLRSTRRLKRIKRRPPSKKKRIKKSRISSQSALTRSPSGILVGEITHFFSKIEVGVVKISGVGMKRGDRILIAGKKTHFNQSVKSLQVESVDVSQVRRGQLVGLKLDQPAKEGDKVFKV